MTKRKRLSLISAGLAVILILVLGVTAVFAQTDGDDDTPDANGETTPPVMPWGRQGMPGHSGMGEGMASMDQYLADALNIDLETLEEARETARVQGIEQALEEGLITEAQAEWLLDNSFPCDALHGRGLPGFAASIDPEALLADALNISVEALQEARQQAHETMLAAMVDAGHMTETQALLMSARHALKDVIDRQALLAEVLGISVDELEEVRGDREAMAALIEDSGLTAAELAEAMQAAHEAAVEQALEDGIITSEQYEALQQAAEFGMGFGGPGPGGMHGRGHGGHGGPGGFGGMRGFHGQAGPGGFGGGLQQPSTAPTSTGLNI